MLIDKYSSDPNGDAPYIDDFIGTYSGAGDYYEYDHNGNLAQDYYKNLLISYNDLNLPEQLDFANNDRINYFYNSTGEKMLRAVNSDSVPELNINTYYFGPFVHEGVFGGETSLKYILTPEGRILNKGTDTSPIWDWEYYLKDHLGNVRVVIAPTEDAGYSAVQQETHYYPYGMRMSQLSNSANSTNDYLFSSKQLEINFDLGWYDFFARPYMPDIIRTPTPDPHAENFYSWSTYSMFGDNPVINIDPTGMDWFVNSETGGVLFLNDIREFDDYHYETYGDNWEWFGENDMFDTDNFSYSENIEVEFMSAKSGESFMSDHGYEKAGRQLVEEKTTTLTFKEDFAFQIEQVRTDKNIVDAKITYALPNELNRKEYVKEPEIKSGFEWSVINDVYIETVPYNKSSLNKSTNSTNAGQNIGFSLIEQLLKSIFKK
ncbi:MAG: hypothetical protein K9H26_13585 [Prolixibacteraceae bacterium]|nr:hypothetical protein [Prolixibacteraceae bacterium]